MKNVVVLGAGYAGVLTAKHLAKKIKKLKKESEFSVSIIDKNPFHTMLTELHEVACNRVEEDSIKMNIKKIFAGRNVKVVLDDIQKIDFGAKKLTGKNSSYAYDYLVIGSGSKPTFFGIEGAKENSFSLWSFDDAVKLRDHFLSTFRSAEAEPNEKERRKMLTFFVVGAGFTGVEMMGELAEWMPRLCNDYHIDPKEVTMTVVDMLDRIIPSLPEKQSSKAHKRLIKMGVTVRLKTGVVSVTPDSIGLKTGDKVETIPTNTVVWAAGIEGSDVLASSEITTVARGRVETNEYLQAKGKDGVYVVGDNIFFIPEGEKASVPQMVENAEASSGLVAENLLADALGKGEKKKYSPKFHGMMVCIGGRYGTAYVGTHTSKFGLPSFFAMLSKHFINVIYFIQVLGWNKIWSYICHEFFRVKDNRSFVGGYFANYSPNFWLFPLRLFLGLSWFMQGMNKLPNILLDPSTIFLFALPGDAAASATETATEAISAVSAASGAAGADTFYPQFIGDSIQWVLDTLVNPAGALLVPEFMKNIVDWSMGVFIAPIAPAFQAFMVLAEIGVGLLLIAGLFTAIGGIGSAALSVMVYVSGMAPGAIIWYFVGSIAVINIGGTGHTFSLDYYVLPVLKKWWSNRKFVKKWYLYND